jgi:hypothetical protein
MYTKIFFLFQFSKHIKNFLFIFYIYVHFLTLVKKQTKVKKQTLVKNYIYNTFIFILSTFKLDSNFLI